MAPPRSLTRLLRIRELEEEQARIELEAANAMVRRLEQVRTASQDRERSGRALVRQGARGGDAVQLGAPAYHPRWADAVADAGPEAATDAVPVTVSRSVPETTSSAVSAAFITRLAGLEQARLVSRQSAAVERPLGHAMREATLAHEEFLTTRIERRQAETLLEEAADRDRLTAARRAQEAFDDWYRGRNVRGRKTHAGSPNSDPECWPGSGAEA